MITVFVATFNGEKYLKELLDSILQQTYSDFIIRVCDDGSTDSTCEILKQYAELYPQKVFMEENEKNSGSAKYNFMNLICKYRDTEYFMCADQDDVWLPNKMEISLEAMKKAEQEHPNLPILIHTDLTVVDAELQVIADSYEQYADANYSKTTLNSMIVQNTVAGCTMMYNQLLARVVRKPCDFFEMHDWWVSLSACCFGKIITVNKPTILYRQHASNVVGAHSVKSFKYKMHRLIHKSQVKAALKNTYLQANTILNTYSDVLDAKHKEFLQEYSLIPKHNKVVRVYKILKLKALKNGFSRKIAHLLFS